MPAVTAIACFRLCPSRPDRPGVHISPDACRFSTIKNWERPAGSLPQSEGNCG